MANQLNGKRVAALVADGFEQVELIDPNRHSRRPERRSRSLAGAGPRAWLESYGLGHGRTVDEPIDTATRRTMTRCSSPAA